MRLICYGRHESPHGPRHLLAVLLVVCASTAPAYAADDAGDASALFGPREPLVMRLEAKWNELTRQPEAGRSRDGRLAYASPAGEEASLSVRIKTRGISRLEFCNFPMLTLELEADEIAGTIFGGQPVVHLTAQCQIKPTYRRYLIQEYLLYRVFALLADHGLRARLISVEYVDPGSKRRPKPTHGFLLEDIGLAAARNGLVWQKPKSTKLSAFDAETRALFVMYQYLIANTDWSLRVGSRGEPCCHNTALLGSPEELSGLVPVPFDLDSAGLINVEYLEPDSQLGIRSSRQRVYRGYCDLNPHLEAAAALIRASRTEILELFDSSEELSERARKDAQGFLDAFFTTIDSPEAFATEIVANCRQPEGSTP